MTEREKRNEEMKARIMRDAKTLCEFIDMQEQETQARERMAKRLAEEVDRHQFEGTPV